MADLLRSQIKESCRLALPEGLKDLMSDISREVLRAQPEKPYQFITDYLAALLVARENLTIASRLCDDVCAEDCNPELADELRYIGLSDEDASIANNIIMKHLETGEVKEANLMIKIAKKTNIAGYQLPAVKCGRAAVERAFQRHLINTTTIFQSSSDSDMDDVTRAANHTLHLYKKTKHTNEELHQAAEKIQAAYRAYGVRRLGPPKEGKVLKKEKPQQKTLRFGATNSQNEASVADASKAQITTVSSTSLAGSYLKLPRFVPYSPHDPVLERDHETVEKESATFFYTGEEGATSTGRQISFQESPQELVEDQAVPADDESEATIDEVDYETDFNNSENTEVVDEQYDNESIRSSD